MLKEQIWESVKIMLGPDEPVPAGYEDNLEAVARKKSCLAGNQPLSAEMQALILCLTKAGIRLNKDSQQLPEDIPQDPDFPAGTKVQFYQDGRILDGTVVGACSEAADKDYLRVEVVLNKKKTIKLIPKKELRKTE